MSSEFSFNAYALGLGGQITSAPEVIPSVGSIVLSGSGGSGGSSIDGYCSPLGSITATKILSAVRGGALPGNRFEADASVSITGLKVRDLRDGTEIFTAEYLWARVYSVHEKNGVLNPDSSITFQAQIKGLRAKDENIDGSLDTTLLERGSTFDGFLEAFSNLSAEEAASYASHFGWGDDEIMESGRRVVPEKFRNINTIPVSLMSRHAGTGNDVKRNKFTVTIPRLAKLHIGEAILKRGRRRMTLLRMELGGNPEMEDTTPPPSGSVSFLALEGNGTEIMP